jgi:hypothetical protein
MKIGRVGLLAGVVFLGLTSSICAQSKDAPTRKQITPEKLAPHPDAVKDKTFLKGRTELPAAGTVVESEKGKSSVRRKAPTTTNAEPSEGKTRAPSNKGS